MDRDQANPDHRRDAQVEAAALDAALAALAAAPPPPLPAALEAQILADARAMRPPAAARPRPARRGGAFRPAMARRFAAPAALAASALLGFGLGVAPPAVVDPAAAAFAEADLLAEEDAFATLLALVQETP